MLIAFDHRIFLRSAHVEFLSPSFSLISSLFIPFSAHVLVSIRNTFSLSCGTVVYDSAARSYWRKATNVWVEFTISAINRIASVYISDCKWLRVCSALAVRMRKRNIRKQ